MSNDQYILSHYKNIARQYGDRGDSTIRDLHIRETEIDFIIAEIFEYVAREGEFPRFLDLGCGNGHTLSVLRELFPEMPLFGLEFSPELFKIAKARGLSQCELIHGDIRESIPFEDIDMILTERVIINLLSRKQQRKALENISNSLRRDGIYIMIESFADSLHELNVMLKQNSLAEIIPSKHNLFVPNGVFQDLSKLNLVERIAPIPSNQLSSYFVLTRVFHPMLRSKKEKRVNNRLVKFFTNGVAPDSGNFSPIRLHSFQKI